MNESPFKNAVKSVLSVQVDPTLEDLRQDLLRAAISYARIRTDYYFLESAVRADRDPTHTRAHNALIDAVNILSRQMAKSGMDITWRDSLGDDRKVIGDFACQLHAALGIACR